jgi:hypothetical protein
MHSGAPAEPVLVAWGITSTGRPVFLGLEPGSAESTDGWAGFLWGLQGPGSAGPAARRLRRRPGLIGAVELILDQSLRQRSLIHRARNSLAKVPVHAQTNIKAEYWAIFDLGDGIEPRDAAIAEVIHRGSSAGRMKRMTMNLRMVLRRSSYVVGWSAATPDCQERPGSPSPPSSERRPEPPYGNSAFLDHVRRHEAGYDSTPEVLPGSSQA